MMSCAYLLDTNVAIWLDRETARVPGVVMSVLNRATIPVWVSSVSFWELAIKQGVGKIDPVLRLEPAMRTYGMQELTVTSKYMDVLRGLPLLHGDPFDRMLVAQAMVEGMTLVTADRRLAGYAVGVLQV